MDKRFLNDFDYEKQKGKIKRSITIDWDLDLELKELEINVSDIINEFLWHYLKKLKEQKLKDNNKAGKEQE